MADLIYYIKLSRCLYEPRHTAYKAIRGFSIFIARGRKKEIILRSDKPPPALEGNPLYVLLNDEAADFVLYYEIGRFCIVQPFPVRCRGPPLSFCFYNQKLGGRL